MPIKLRCHKCYAEYEFDESMAGRFLQCQCGENLTIPGADASDGKKCAQCGADCELESVICIKCGYNFKTGQNLSSGESEDEESQSAWSRIAPLIKPFVIILIVGIVALVVYISMTSKHYGISKSAKLGTMDKLEKHLLGMKLTKQNEPRELPEAFGAKATAYFFDDKILEEKSRGTVSESVFVALDKDGNVCAVGGTFMTVDDSVPTAGSKIMRFLRSFWKEVGLPNPSFREEVKGEGRFKYRQEVGEVENGDIKGLWEKREAGIPLMKSIDTVKILKKNLSFDNIP